MGRGVVRRQQYKPAGSSLPPGSTDALNLPKKHPSGLLGLMSGSIAHQGDPLWSSGRSPV